MHDLKTMNMSALIKLHNELAQKLGVAAETSFKSLGAARSAITTLEIKMNQVIESPQESVAAEAMATVATVLTAPVAAVTDPNKYNSSGLRGPNQGVGAFAKELILAGKNNADVLAAVRVKFPDAKTSTGCVAFYRTALKKTPGGLDPAKLRADAQKLLDQAASVEAGRAAAAQKLAEAAAAASAAANPPVPAAVEDTSEAPSA